MADVQLLTAGDINWNDVQESLGGGLYCTRYLDHYANVDLLGIIDNSLVALWPIPYIETELGKIACRDIRLLPYHSPLIFRVHSLEKKKILYKLIKFVQKRYIAIDLPLGTEFGNVTGFTAAGFSVEYRNTHHFTPEHSFIENLHSRARNHLRYAESRLRCSISDSCEVFNFERGVITSCAQQRARRRGLVKSFFEMHKGVTLNAYADDSLVGQAIVLHDSNNAYLFHSWFSRESSVRGIPIYLIKHAIDWAFSDKNLKCFDLEGSVLPQVDYFFSSLGGMHKSYPHIYWAREKQQLLSILAENIFNYDKLDRELYISDAEIEHAL